MLRGNQAIFGVMLLALAAPAGGSVWAEQGRSPAAVRESDTVTVRSGAWLGVLVTDAIDGGVPIAAVVPGSPAARVRLRDGDLLVEINGAPVTDGESIATLLSQVAPGERVELALKRGDTVIRRVLATRARPAQNLARATGLTAWASGSRQPYSLLLRGDSLGLLTQEISPELRSHYGASAVAGVLVTRVSDSGLGARAGVQVGDVLVQLGERPVETPADLAPMRWLPGSDQGELVLHVVRAGKKQRLEAELRRGYPEGGVARVSTIPAASERARLLRQISAAEREMERLRRQSDALDRRLAELKESLSRVEAEDPQ